VRRVGGWGEEERRRRREVTGWTRLESRGRGRAERRFLPSSIADGTAPRFIRERERAVRWAKLYRAKLTAR